MLSNTHHTMIVCPKYIHFCSTSSSFNYYQATNITLPKCHQFWQHHRHSDITSPGSHFPSIHTSYSNMSSIGHHTTITSSKYHHLIINHDRARMAKWQQGIQIILLLSFITQLTPSSIQAISSPPYS